MKLSFFVEVVLSSEFEYWVNKLRPVRVDKKEGSKAVRHGLDPKFIIRLFMPELYFPEL